MQIDKSKVKSKDTASNKSASKEQNNIFAFLPAILVFNFWSLTFWEIATRSLP